MNGNTDAHADKLCGLALLLNFAPLGIAMIIKNQTIFNILFVICNLTSIILCLHVRKNYPNNAFGKALFIIYCLIIVSTLAIFAFVQLCCRGL